MAIIDSGRKVGQAIGRYVRTDRHIRRFYKRMIGETVLLVVSSGIDPDSVRQSRKQSAVGAHNLERVLTRCGCTTPMEQSAAVVRANDLRRQHMLVIGGPVPNDVSRQEFDREKVVFRFGGSDGHAIVRKSGELVVAAEFGPSRETVTRDFGIITRLPNRFNPEKDVLLACGCFEWGTRAALDLLADSATLRWLNSHTNRYFQVVCECRVEESGPLEPHLLKETWVAIE